MLAETGYWLIICTCMWEQNVFDWKGVGGKKPHK